MFNWTPERDQYLIREWNAGTSGYALGLHFRVTKNSIIARVRRLRTMGVELRKAEKVKVEPVPRVKVTTGFWTPEREAQLCELWDEGRSQGYISAVMGIVRGSVASKIDRLKKAGRVVRNVKPNAVVTLPPPVLSMRVWTEEKTQDLIEQWNDGAQASDLASYFRTTTKAIQAKVHELRKIGVEMRYGGGGFAYDKPKRRAPVVIVDAPEPPVGYGTPLIDLKRNQCRFPTGGRAPEWLFCGNETAPGESWCVHCRKIVYQPAHQQRAA